MQNAEQSIQSVSDLINHPGLKYLTGTLYGKAPVIPGTEQASANALLDQIKGQQFLQAYQTLKGGGQITEVEGKKATDALSRMQRSVSQEDFIKAGKEYMGILQKGIQRAQEQAKGNFNPLPKTTPLPTNSQTINGITYIQQNGKWYQQ